MYSLLIALAVLLVSVGGNTGGQDQPEVAAPAGTFRGITLTSRQGYPFTAFLGIPFALPPVGNLRFSKPQPYPKIEGVFEAFRVAPTCIQSKDFDLGSPSSEDCLYLNVYVPHDSLKEAQNNDGETRPRKVFVYIHGGGYFLGSANQQVPGDLVALGDVIVVTLNYRLFWLGFLKGNTSELPGNLGLWDQLMALNWVKDNIRSFRGDSEDITLGGNSMGAYSTSALSITPYGKGLFTKAFMTSYTAFTNPSTFGSSDYLLDTLADLVACKNGPSDSKDPDALVRCLRALPSEAFSLPVYLPALKSFTTIDGDLFQRPISELLQDKEYLTSVGFYARDNVVSVTNNEGILFFHGVFKLGPEPEDVNAEFLNKVTQIPVTVSEKILAWFQRPNHSFINPAVDVFGDIMLTMASFQFLETASSGYKDQSLGEFGRTYALVMNFTPSYNPRPHEGVFHAMDLVYLFDLDPHDILSLYYADLTTDPGMTKDDLALKNRYINILTDFMRKGDPGVTIAEETNVHWPTFDLESENYLSLESHPLVRQFPLKDRRLFWKQEFPKYMAEFKNSQSKEEL